MIIMIILLILTVYFSGCTSNKSTNNSSENGGEKQNVEQMKADFETAIESVAGDFVDESGGYNFDTSQREIDYIQNYNQSFFDQHSKLIYENDDICYNDSGYEDYLEYRNCRDHVIEGSQHLVNKNYSEARKSLLVADCDITETNDMGDLLCVQFGFEHGVVDILWFMGYK